MENVDNKSRTLLPIQRISPSIANSIHSSMSSRDRFSVFLSLKKEKKTKEEEEESIKKKREKKRNQYPSYRRVSVPSSRPLIKRPENAMRRKRALERWIKGRKERKKEKKKEKKREKKGKEGKREGRKERKKEEEAGRRREGGEGGGEARGRKRSGRKKRVEGRGGAEQ